MMYLEYIYERIQNLNDLQVRFAAMFKYPLFLESTLAREVSAMQSESDIQNSRQLEVRKDLCRHCQQVPSVFPIIRG